MQQHRRKILEIAAKYDAHDVALCGSVARGEHHASSDIDFLFSAGPRFSLFDRVALKYALEDLLGARVDLIERSALHPLARAHVLSEAVPID